MDIKFQLVPDASGRIRKLIGSLGSAGRKELNDGAAAQLWADVRAHLKRYAATHHASAGRLGAMPTGHLEKAAATMTKTSSADSATVQIASPGIRRALGPLMIRPVRARALTIPIHALAYGRRVAELARSHRVYRMGKTDVLAADIEGVPTPMYVLKAAVTVPQDRSLLPPDAALERSVRLGYLGVIRSIVAKAGLAS